MISQDLKGIKIGWIDGYADKAWKWARMLGADVQLLSDEEIISEDFSMMKNKKFDEFRALKVNIKTKKFRR